MTRRAPLVSVVTATRSRPHLLEVALKSIQRQSFADFEVIVVDDGSPADVHEEYGRIWSGLDDRFVLYHASPPGGPGSDPGRGRNFGTALSNSDLVAYLDHDDFWVSPDHLAVAAEAMQRSNAGYFFTHVRFEPELDGLMWAGSPLLLGSGRPVLTSPVVSEVPLSLFLQVMRHSHIHPSHSVVRRQVWERAGKFIEGLRTADDVNFMLRVADLDPGILYRPEASVAIRMPEGKSFSLSSSALTQILAEHQAMLDIRSRCRTTEVRRCARARQAWVLRQLAAETSDLRPAEALRFAAESLTLFPTAGSAMNVVKTLLRYLKRDLRQRP